MHPQRGCNGTAVDPPAAPPPCHTHLLRLLHGCQLLLQPLQLHLIASPQPGRLLLQLLVRGTCSLRQLLPVLLVRVQRLRPQLRQLRLLLLLQPPQLLRLACCRLC
jgi:hypothetical protein